MLSLALIPFLGLSAIALAGEEPSAVFADSIAVMIEQLGAPGFEARQQATDQLWKAGAAAEAALRQAAKSNDPEIRTRAAALLNRLRLGIGPDTPADVALLVDQFCYGGSTNTRRQALAQLQAAGHW